VGVCVLECSGDCGSLEHLWITPEHQGRGLGRALAEQVLGDTARRGISAVELESDPDAELFYARLGARRIATLPAPMPGAPERMLVRMEFGVRS